jgi:hypothetical protein
MNPESSIDYVKGESAVPPFAACLAPPIRDQLMQDYPAHPAFAYVTNQNQDEPVFLMS